MRINLKRFELFYSSGGHGGPYIDLEEAIRAATRRVSNEERRISICPYDALAPGGFGPVVYRVTWCGNCAAPRQEARPRALVSRAFPESGY